MKKEAYALAGFAVVSWAAAPVMFKALVGGLEFKSAVFFFLLLGSGAMFIYLTKTDPSQIINVKKEKIPAVLFMGVMTYLHYFCYTYSLHSINASNVIVLAKLSPIFQLAFAIPLLKERVRISTWFFFLMGFAGAAIVITNGNPFQDFNLHGAYFTAILAGLFWALFLVLTRKSEMNFFAVVGWALLVGAVLMGIYLAVTKSLVLPKGIQWIYLGILGIIPTALGPVAWVKGIEKAERVARIANLEYLTPVLGVVFSWVFLKESISGYLILGLGILSLSIYLNARCLKGKGSKNE